MKCLYIITPPNDCLPEEREQLGGLIVSKVRPVSGGCWEVAPRPTLRLQTCAVIDGTGQRANVGDLYAIHPHESWLIPLDCTRKDLSETLHQSA